MSLRKGSERPTTSEIGEGLRRLSFRGCAMRHHIDPEAATAVDGPICSPALRDFELGCPHSKDQTTAGGSERLRFAVQAAASHGLLTEEQLRKLSSFIGGQDDDLWLADLAAIEIQPHLRGRRSAKAASEVNEALKFLGVESPQQEPTAREVSGALRAFQRDAVFPLLALRNALGEALRLHAGGETLRAKNLMTQFVAAAVLYQHEVGEVPNAGPAQVFGRFYFVNRDRCKS